MPQVATDMDAFDLPGATAPLRRGETNDCTWHMRHDALAQNCARTPKLTERPKVWISLNSARIPA
jgi:hypothetical protein